MSETLINEQLQQRWHPFIRTGFRFAFVYLLLYNLPFPLTAIPYVNKTAELYNSLWTWIVPRLARVAFNREVSSVFNGSGDRTFDFLLVACLLLTALVITVIWTFFDRKRLSYPTLYRWLNLYVRFSLGTTMIGYGAFKVISSQFPPPGLDRLMQSYCDSSPMGLLWTFMGASESYTMFVGFAEMIAGILLFPRKTSTLGALMSTGVLSNVVALNFGYDVPVKLYSIHLLAMAVFLLLPDARRLANFFILNRPVECVREQSLFRRTVWHRGALVLASLFVITVVGTSLYQSYDQRRSFMSLRSPLYGVWEVEEFSLGQSIPTASTQRWQRIIFDSPGRITVQTPADPHQRFSLQLDQGKRTLTLRKREDPGWNTMLTYEQVSSEVITLAGALNGSELTARLRRSEERKFLLNDRGFHWINEVPFNR
jgi:hypothetical protein